jgi:hypothetical protein
MSGLRFSIANLLAAVAIVAIGLAALNSPTNVVGGVLGFATIGLVLAAVLGAVYRTGEVRAFWLGVALFGGSYFVIIFSGAFPVASEHLREPLKAVRAAFWTLRIPEGSQQSTSGMDTEYDHDAKTTLAWPSWHNGFGVTIHCLINWLFALAGGTVGRWIYATSIPTNNKLPSR